jgi:hypothetical protein
MFSKKEYVSAYLSVRVAAHTTPSAFMLQPAYAPAFASPCGQ